MDLEARPSPVDVAQVLGLTIPVELGVLLDQSSTARARFWRLEDTERLGFVRYIEEGESSSSRHQRATRIATSLLGAASDLRVSSRSWQI
jgi:uncharacterized protein YdeI (YjbR/CyaY-like superfamily)